MMPARSQGGSHREVTKEQEGSVEARLTSHKKPKAFHSPSKKWGPAKPRTDRDCGPRSSEDNYLQAARNATEYEFDRIRIDLE